MPVKYDKILRHFIAVEVLPKQCREIPWLSRIKLDWKNIFRVKEVVIKDQFSVPKSETFPADSTIYCKNTKIYSAVKAMASRFSLVP